MIVSASSKRSPLFSRGSLKVLTGLLILCLFCVGIGYVVAGVISQSYVISSGVYGGSPAYTVWDNGDGYYYAKNRYGVLAAGSTVFTSVMDAVLADLRSGRDFQECVKLVGTFSVLSRVELPSYVFLDLTEAILNLADDDWAVFYATGKTDITIYGGLIDGYRSTNTDGRGIYLVDCGSVLIDGVKIKSAYYHGVDLQDGCVDVVVQNCEVWDCGLVPPAYGINCYGSPDRAENIAYLHNYVHDNFESGLRIDRADYVRVIGNELVNNKGAAAGDGIDLYWCTHGEVADNYCDSSIYGIGLYYSTYIMSVTGNTLTYNDAHGLAILGTGLSCFDITVSGNTVRENRQYGIIGYNCSWLTITGNTVKNNNQDDDGYDGIALDYSFYCVVSGNLASDDQSSATQEWGIVESTSADYNNIVGNSAFANAVGGISCTGANSECHSCFNGTSWVT